MKLVPGTPVKITGSWAKNTYFQGFTHIQTTGRERIIPAVIFSCDGYLYTTELCNCKIKTEEDQGEN